MKKNRKRTPKEEVLLQSIVQAKPTEPMTAARLERKWGGSKKSAVAETLANLERDEYLHLCRLTRSYEPTLRTYQALRSQTTAPRMSHKAMLLEIAKIPLRGNRKMETLVSGAIQKKRALDWLLANGFAVTNKGGTISMTWRGWLCLAQHYGVDSSLPYGEMRIEIMTNNVL